jgi:PAS domain S-box-containing protein
MASETILIVEDDAILAAHLEDTLAHLGYSALAPVATGEMAIEAVRTRKPDLVVMDIELAGDVNGIEAAERIGFFSDVPVIYLTGYSQESVLARAKTTAPYGYLIKPVPERELAAAIGIALYRRTLDTQLRESEEKYRNVFAVENDALILIDQATARIVEVNESTSLLYGYSAEELTGKDLVELSAEPQETARAVRTSVSRVSGRLHRKKDGSTFPVDISVSFFTLRNRGVALGAVRDMTELMGHRQKLEDLVRERTEELAKRTKDVEELNITLKVLLRQVQEDKENLEERVVSNVERLVLPYAEKIAKGRLDSQQRSHFDVMMANLREIVSPFLHTVQHLNLTPREVQVVTLIKDGKATKEIAQIIGVSVEAINSYRNSIRMKLGLNNQKVNLQTYLQSLK